MIIIFDYFSLVVFVEWTTSGAPKLGQSGGILTVVHRHVGGFGKHLEVPVHCLRKRWRGFLDSILSSVDFHRPAPLLSRNDPRPVLQFGIHQTVEYRPDCQGYWVRTSRRFCVDIHVLHVSYGHLRLLLLRLVPRGASLVKLSEWN